MQLFNYINSKNKRYTKALSQVEGRVKADIWYLEHWILLLDLYNL